MTEEVVKAPVRNGVLRIPRKGLRKFQYGEEGDVNPATGAPYPEVLLDVVQACNQWDARDRAFRDEDGEGKVPREKYDAYNEAKYAFAREALGVPIPPAGEDKVAEVFSLRDAHYFVHVLQAERKELLGFFDEKKPDSPPSPGGSTTLRFSTD